MAGITKYSPINDSSIISDFKSHFSIRKTKKTFSFVYGFICVFIVFTIFLAFIPSSNLFSITTTSTNSPTSSSLFSNTRSHFSSIYYYIFPNSSSLPSRENPQNGAILPIVNQTHSNNVIPPKPSSGSLKGNQNQTQSEKFEDKVGVFKANQSKIGDKSVNSSTNHIPVEKNVKIDGQNEIVKNLTSSPTIEDKSANTPPKLAPIDGKKEIVKNLTSSLMKKQNNGEKGIDDLIKNLMNCDLFDGNWVRDESYPLYKPGSCSLIDEQFNCFSNGRPDNGYHKLKWKPKSCNLPRLDGSRMLELLRGKRLVFVGDSLNRNMWESLICILKNSVKDQKKVYEESGRHHFRSEASYSFIFVDYKCTVEFFVSPFLVEEWEATNKNGTKKETLRLDLIGSYANKYKNADIIVFNTGHWWTHDKTSKGEDYYQEGSHVYRELNVLEAFRKALTTWGRWVDSNVNPLKSLVFFRGYSVSHFSGGQWNSGGQCDSETEPIKNDTYLSHYPPKMTVLEKILKGMKTHVTYLNVTRMTDYRKDGHPSIYRKQHYTDEEKKSPLRFQDCSHWCLPGVPDAWNEILYAELLVKLKLKQQ